MISAALLQYFHFVAEMEWAIELALEKGGGLPVAATMCIGPGGDGDGNSPGDCAVRMARAGASIVGVNCLFDPFITLETMAEMKKGLDDAGLKTHLMCQALGFRTPDGGNYGWINLKEYPYGIVQAIAVTLRRT